ncbi:hypothetical protein [Streptomyces lavendofoliae]|uniref:hypothetical protein n=1 Tax=Streptomyces lavendofoliae TaxID=67314 RepID=UPI00300ED2F9
MGRVKARKGETAGVRPARTGEGDAVRAYGEVWQPRLEAGRHFAELEAHQNLYAQQIGVQRTMLARINAVCARPGLHGRSALVPRVGIGRQLIRAAADTERRRGRRMLTG